MVFWPKILEHLESGERVFIGLVADHSIHSPGTTGARIAVFETGDTIGTIGGGVMEHNLVGRATDVLAASDRGPFKPEIHKLYHRKHGEGEKSGLICAGYQTNLYLVLDPTSSTHELDRVVSNDDGFLEVGPTGIRYRERAELDRRVQSRLIQDGDTWVYLERLVNLRRVAIMGAGHCGLALSRILHGLGFYVAIFDTRPRVPTLLENDAADRKEIIEDFVDAGSMVDLPDQTCVVVMTTGLPSDVRALQGVLTGEFPFIGVMGSRSKIARIKKDLESAGVDEAAINRIVAPIGLPMRSNTPQEIAVSVAAQLLQLGA